MKNKPENSVGEEWKQCNASVFWGEIAPCNHVVQIYESDDIVLDSLETFIISGLTNNESVIIIATPQHLKALNRKLILKGYDPEKLQNEQVYQALDAEEILSKFMVNGWPDDEKFMEVVTSLISRARGKEGRKVRAYGEMVAILWAKGMNGATVHLEHLWNQFCESEIFCLFCAYPKAGFTQDVEASINHICSAHTKQISGTNKSTTEVFYKKTK
jgi:hypothetical protein